MCHQQCIALLYVLKSIALLNEVFLIIFIMIKPKQVKPREYPYRSSLTIELPNSKVSEAQELLGPILWLKNSH